MKFTEFLLDLLIKFVKEAGNKKYIVGGGLALDLAYGKITRPHEDLDIYPYEGDLDYWIKWFQDQGLSAVDTPDTKNHPNAFVVIDKENNYVADIYCVRFEENGEISGLWRDENGEEEYGTWDDKNHKRAHKVKFRDVEINVEYFKDVIDQKLAHEKRHNEPLTGKHLHDLELAKKL